MGYCLWEDSGTWQCSNYFDTLQEAQAAHDEEVRNGTSSSMLLILESGKVPWDSTDEGFDPFPCDGMGH